MSRQSRRDFLKVSAALAGGSLLVPQFLGAQTSSSRKNFLFISIDDLNDFPASFGGYSGILTPNIDKLAREGVAFQRAYCAAPYCGASRSATLTGAAPYRTNVTSNRNILDPTHMESALSRLGQSQILTLPGYMKSQGFKTIGAGKIFHGGFGAGSSNAGYDAPNWDDWFNTDFMEVSNKYPGVRNYRDNRTADQIRRGENAPGDMPSMIGADYNSLEQENTMPDKKVAQWITNQFLNGGVSADKPFFMAAGFYRPHIAMYVPQRFYDLYPLQSIRVPNYQEQLADLRDLPEFALRNLLNMDWTAYGAKLANGAPSSDHYLLEAMATKEGRNGHAQAIQAYLASITFVDECVGQILSALDRSGLRENTTVILWSDHGWFLGEKLSWQKYKMWEKSSRVPLIISTPGGPRGNSFTPVSTLDLFPTLVEMTGGHVPAWAANQLDGESLSPLLASPTIEKASYAITTQSLQEAGVQGNGVFHSVRTNRWRYTSYPGSPGDALTAELYDLTADPDEKRNLLYWEPARYAEVEKSLATLLLRKVLEKTG